MALLTENPLITERGKWDLKLIKAYYVNQAFEIDGHPIHIEESPDIVWLAKRKTVNSLKVVEAEQERMQKNDKAKYHGVRVYAEPKLLEGRKWPTRKDWAERQKKSSPEKLDTRLTDLAMVQEQEAKLKVEAMRNKA